MKGAGPAGQVRPERATLREGNPNPEEGVWLTLYACNHLCNLGKKPSISSHLALLTTPHNLPPSFLPQGRYSLDF